MQSVLDDYALIWTIIENSSDSLERMLVFVFWSCLLKTRNKTIFKPVLCQNNMTQTGFTHKDFYNFKRFFNLLETSRMKITEGIEEFWPYRVVCTDNLRAAHHTKRFCPTGHWVSSSKQETWRTGNYT